MITPPNSPCASIASISSPLDFDDPDAGDRTLHPVIGDVVVAGLPRRVEDADQSCGTALESGLQDESECCGRRAGSAQARRTLRGIVARRSRSCPGRSSAASSFRVTVSSAMFPCKYFAWTAFASTPAADGAEEGGREALEALVPRPRSAQIVLDPNEATAPVRGARPSDRARAKRSSTNASVQRSAADTRDAGHPMGRCPRSSRPSRTVDGTACVT